VRPRGECFRLVRRCSTARGRWLQEEDADEDGTE